MAHSTQYSSYGEVRTHETSLKEKRKSLEPTASRRITMDPRKRASYSEVIVDAMTRYGNPRWMIYA